MVTNILVTGHQDIGDQILVTIYVQVLFFCFFWIPSIEFWHHLWETVRLWHRLWATVRDLVSRCLV